MSTESFTDHLPANVVKNVEDLYKRVTPDDEFEFMFFNYQQGKNNNQMGFESFKQILQYLTHISKTDKSTKQEQTVTLDTVYTEKSDTGSDRDMGTFRATVHGQSKVNRYMRTLHKRNNHVIMSTLAKKSVDDKDITLLKKVKNRDDVVDINDFDIRVRLAKEVDLTKEETKKLHKLSETTRRNIIFRYKQRYSLILIDNADVTLRVDLTSIKMNSNIKTLNRSQTDYELEIDITSKKKGGAAKKYLETMFKQATTLVKIIQQSNHIISHSEENKVLDMYADQFKLNREKMTTLDARRSTSLEIQHVTDKLPNNYAATDKADGERFFLYAANDKIYLISYNLHVRNTGIVLTKKQQKYNQTTMDGELIYLAKFNRYAMMIFDCLYKGAEDVREEADFMTRLSYADEVINDCFVSDGQTNYKFLKYNKTFDADKIAEFHNKEVDNFMIALNHDLLINKNVPLIRRKYFIPVTGGQDNEVFKNMAVIWDRYVFNSKVTCPYVLDGVMVHPLSQSYTTSAKDTKLIEYKWKPPEKNSVDFYLTFEKSRDTGKELILYDNSNEEAVRDKPYKIAHLHVGKVFDGVEKPVLFQPATGKHIAHLYLDNGAVRDTEGNVIQDRTVVEMYYNSESNSNSRFRWVALRTRYDKTESVNRYRKKYGNYSSVADKVWRSITNPFTFDDITKLANNDSYSAHMKTLRGKIDHSIIMTENNENAYYQIKSNIGKAMRNFHNRIKDNLIYTYLYQTYSGIEKINVLDIGCGKGGDVSKWYYPKSVKLYVGIDTDNQGLMDSTDGAWSRYNGVKKGKAAFPSMFFIHGDGGALLNPEAQINAVGRTSDKNTEMLNRFFSSKASERTMFDRINLSFSIHFFLKNETVWSNFTKNIDDYLTKDGYLIFETFDANQVINILGDKDRYAATYTDKKGESQVYFEILKKFKDIKPGQPIGLGHAIDFHNSSFNQKGTYTTEYLVNKDFIVKELRDRCNLELVDSDLFKNQFNIYRDFFGGVFKAESDPRSRKFFANVSTFYTNEDSETSASFKMSALNRYYAFKRIQ